MELQLLDIDYQVENEEVKVRLFAKNKEGETILCIDEKFQPYFYAIPEPEAQLEETEEKIRETNFESDKGKKLEVTKIERIAKEVDNEEKDVFKVNTNMPANVPKLKNELWDFPGIEHCREFDIPFYRRYLIDKNLRPEETFQAKTEEELETNDFAKKVKISQIDTLGDSEGFEYSKLAFDIEVYQDQVIMISFYSRDYQKLITTEDIDKEYSEECESEEELLKRFCEIINKRNPDIITGYNTDEYDFDVLRDRFQHHNMEMKIGRNGERMKFNRRGRFKGARIKGRPHLDLYPFITHILAPGLDSETLDLDSVAQEMLGENKENMSWEEMKQSWKNKENLEEFAKYALKDSELTYQLSEEIVPQIRELARITGLTHFDACRLTYGQLTENFLIREAHQRNQIAKNRPGMDNRRKRQRQTAYTGGFVYTPEPGLYENIATFDFRSLYPTVMVSHNISPDTLNLEKCEDRFELEEFEYDFCQDEQGFFPQLIQELVKDRYEIKSEMKELKQGKAEYKALDSEQKAKKVLANSFYGYLGYEGARWYSRESAEATTYLGRKYIEETIEKAEEKGFEVVYGDTDSVFLKKDNIREEMDEFLDEVNSDLPEFMELEFEGFFKRGFFTSTDSGEGAKKKYALLDESGGLKITGFEQVRRDWSPIAKDTQKQVLRRVLEDDVEGAAELVKDTIKRLKEGEVPVEKLRIYTTLTKPPEEYDSKAPHVEATKKAKKRGDTIEPETTIDYVITNTGSSISDKAELTKYAESYDPGYYVENQILPVTLRVLKVFGYTEGQLKGKGKQSGLGQF